MLLGMNLTSSHLTYNIQRKQNHSLQFLQTAKNNAMPLKNWVQFSKFETFKKLGQSSLLIIIHMLSWYGESLYRHLDFSLGFVRFLLFLPHRLKARNKILHKKYYFSLPQAKRNPVLLSLTVKMTLWNFCIMQVTSNNNNTNICP